MPTAVRVIDQFDDLVGTRALFPATSAGKGPYVVATGDNFFEGHPDPTIMLAYNMAYNGAPIVAGEPAMGYVLENDYDDASGQNKMEAYIQIVPIAGSNGMRPIFFQYNRATNELSASILQGNPVRFVHPHGVSDTPLVLADIQRNLMTLYSPVDTQDTAFNITAPGTGKTSGVQMGFNAVDSVAKFTPYGRNEFGFEVCNNTSGTVARNLVMSLFAYSGAVGSAVYAAAIGERDNSSALTVSNKNGAAALKGLTVRLHASQSANAVNVESSAGAVLFAIEPDGDIRTARSTANTNTPSGATARQLALYDAAGTLLGYVPIYGSAW